MSRPPPGRQSVILAELYPLDGAWLTHQWSEESGGVAEARVTGTITIRR
jgi:hypothetical protein